MLTRKVIDVKTPLTPEEKAELDALDNRPVIPDEDCPEITDAEIVFYDYIMKKYNTRYITKELILNEMAYLSKFAKTAELQS